MKKAKPKKAAESSEIMKSHYDFSKGEKPNYAERFPEGAVITVHGSNGSHHKRVRVTPIVVLLDADVSKVFHNGRAVNAALRHLIAAVPKQ